MPRYSIRDGAGSLIFALPHMPVGVHVAVVDPGVGTERLGIAIKVARGDVLIGPDNGLLTGAAELLGGIVEVRSLENRDLMLPVVTSSFHGRDIFSPVAAHLAMGTPFESVGPTVPAERLVRLAEPTATVRDGGLDTVITHILIFGNVHVRRDAGRPRGGDRAARAGTAPRDRLPGDRRTPAGPRGDDVGGHVRRRAGRGVAADVGLRGRPVARRQPGGRRGADRADGRSPGANHCRLTA